MTFALRVQIGIQRARRKICQFVATDGQICLSWQNKRSIIPDMCIVRQTHFAVKSVAAPKNFGQKKIPNRFYRSVKNYYFFVLGLLIVVVFFLLLALFLVVLGGCLPGVPPVADVNI